MGFGGLIFRFLALLCSCNGTVVQLVPLWPVWVVPTLALMHLSVGHNVRVASPDGVPELAHMGKYLLFFISLASTAIAVSCCGWCAIAPSWLVIE